MMNLLLLSCSLCPTDLVVNLSFSYVKTYIKVNIVLEDKWIDTTMSCTFTHTRDRRFCLYLSDTT